MPKIKYKDINLGLVRGRHELPVDDYIFDQIDNVLDFENLEKTAQEKLAQYQATSYNEMPHLNVYVTGLTPATVAVMKNCMGNGIPLTFMHFDRETNNYVAQDAVTLKDVERAFEFDGYKGAAMDMGQFNGAYRMSKPEITTVMGPDPKLRKKEINYQLHNAEGKAVILNAMDEQFSEKLKEAIDEEAFVVINQPSGNRKQRAQTYQQIKELTDEPVKTIVAHQPYEEIVKNNPNIDPKKLYQAYVHFRTPRIDVDCDKIKVTAPNISEYEAEMTHRIDEAHNNPYHMESLREHVDMTIRDAEKTNDPLLIRIAQYHDDGKAIARKANTKDLPHANFAREALGGEFDQYIGHDNIGAMYHLIRNQYNLSPEMLKETEIIQQHMQAHFGFSDEYIAENHLTPDILEPLKQFAEIDSKANVKDPAIFKPYAKLAEEARLQWLEHKKTAEKAAKQEEVENKPETTKVSEEQTKLSADELAKRIRYLNLFNDDDNETNTSAKEKDDGLEL